MAGKWQCPTCEVDLVKSEISGRAIQAHCSCPSGIKHVNALNKSIDRKHVNETRFSNVFEKKPSIVSTVKNFLSRFRRKV